MTSICRVVMGFYFVCPFAIFRTIFGSDGLRTYALPGERLNKTSLFKYSNVLNWIAYCKIKV